MCLKKPQLNHTPKYINFQDENIIWKMAFWNEMPYKTTYATCPASVTGSEVSIWLKRHLYCIPEDGVYGQYQRIKKQTAAWKVVVE